jgi:predicted nucleic acid-binding protein
MSALLGGSARRILYDRRYRFIIPERTTWEVKRYLPFLAAKSRVSEADVLQAFEQMPLDAVGDRFYLHRLPDAHRLGLRDPNDADVVALALERGALIWSHDKDLLALSGVRTVMDGDLF